MLIRLLRALLLVATLAAAANSSTVSHPGFDFSSIGGEILVLGSFDGLSFYNSANASAFLSAADSNSLSLYLRNISSDAVEKVASLLGGSVLGLLQLSDDTVLVLGSFTLVNGDDAQSPVILNITLGDVSSIFDLLSKRADSSFSGSVLSTLVDDDLVYLGGDFEFDDSYGAAIYNITSKELSTLPFLGFGENASVNAIEKYAPDGLLGSIIFGGSFSSLGIPELLMHNASYITTVNNNTNSTNSSLISAEQVISLKHATFANVNGASGNDDSSVICPSTSGTWSLANSSGGQWTAELPSEMQGIAPTKVRLYVPEGASDGIKTFRIYTYPNNGIMNLTYVDPLTNELAYCDAYCPLQLQSTLGDAAETNIDDADAYEDDDSIYINSDGSFAMYYADSKARTLGYGSNYQEFAFVNTIGIDKIGLTTIEWYGDHGEFSGFELYTNSVTVYANETLNESNCGSESSDDSNLAELTSGTWESVTSLTDSITDTDYLVSVVDGSSSITLYPNISYSGYYSILLYTPGCSADGSCANRSIVNVTVSDGSDTVLASSSIYQNNLEEKFDYLFYGHLNGTSSGSDRNKVFIQFESAIDSSVTDPWMVADRVVANIVSLDSYDSTNSTNSTDSTNTTSYYLESLSLNGLFEYSIANFSSFLSSLVYEEVNGTVVIEKTNTFVGNSTINLLSNSLATSSVIDDIKFDSSSKQLMLLGEFSSNNITLLNGNLITLDLKSYNTSSNETIASLVSKRFVKRAEQTIFDATFNDSITAIESIEGGIIALGDFAITGGATIENLADENSTTSDAYNFAYYSNGQWYSFDNPYYNENFSRFTSIDLNGTEYFIFSSENEIYLVWDNTAKEWSSSNNKLDITASLTLSNDEQQIIGGSSFGVMDFYGNNLASFKNNDEFNTLPISISTGTVMTSFFLNSSFTVIGGRFTANSSIENVAILTSASSRPLSGDPSWDSDTFVTSLYIDTDDEFLFIGTNGSLGVDSFNTSGLAVYSLSNDSFYNVQPPGLSKNDGSSISVNALALNDEKSQLLVGGNFDSAGSLDCGSVCLYDISNTRWNNPLSGSTSLTGEVTDAKFLNSENVLLSGNLTINDTDVSFVVYDFSSGDFASTGDVFNSIKATGAVKKYMINDDSDGLLNKRMVALGSDFVTGYNGSAWARIDDDIVISDATQLTDIKLVQLSKDNSANSEELYFDKDMALLLTGLFNISEYGLVNTAIYDGTSWIPYIYSLEGSSMGIIDNLLFEDIYKSQSSSDIKSSSHHMTTGQVVGVSLACAIGSTALLGLLYIIPMLFLFRESKRKTEVNQRIYEDDMMDAVNPEDLFNEMEAQKVY